MQDSDANLQRQVEYYLRKYELNPHSRAFAPLADLYRKTGRVEDALELLAAGLAEHPAYISALVIQARCHLDLGRTPAAQAAFARVLELDPDNLVAIKQMADMALTVNDQTRAAELLERVVNLDPSDERSAAQLEWLRGTTTSAAPPAAPAQAAAPAAPSPEAATAETAASDRAAIEPGAVELASPTAPGEGPAAARAEPAARVPTPTAAGEEGEPGAFGEEQRRERQSFATKTLAEIYLAQGYRDKALTVLREILARHPEREDVREKIAELERSPDAGAAPAPGAQQPAGAGAPPESRQHFESWLDRLSKSKDEG